MANRRMLSKTISTSRKVNRLPDRAALLYTWMIPHTDDYGRLEGDSLSIKAKVVPMRQITEKEIEEDLKILENNGLIKRYEINEEMYIEIIAFESFQTFRSDRPRRALYPDSNGILQFGGDTGGIPTTYQRDTTDIPMGDISQCKRSNKLSNKLREDKSTSPILKIFNINKTIKYLNNIPESDIKEFISRFVATEKEIKNKAESLKLYCESKGRRYSNYRSFLLNALKRDFKERGEKQGKYSKLS